MAEGAQKTNYINLNERLYTFALGIIRQVRAIPREVVGFEIAKQLIRSGTSIAANYEEASSAFSKQDFTYKISIAFKESKETSLWLRLLRDSKLLLNQDLDELIDESRQIANILAKSLKTSRERPGIQGKKAAP